MQEEYNGEKLCIFIGEADKHKGQPLYELLLERALKMGLSGGTVIRGREGFGAHGTIHSTKILRLAEDLPVVLEFVGRTAKIQSFLDDVEPLLSEGLLTRTEVHITKFRKQT